MAGWGCSDEISSDGRIADQSMIEYAKNFIFLNDWIKPGALPQNPAGLGQTVQRLLSIVAQFARSGSRTKTDRGRKGHQSMKGVIQGVVYHYTIDWIYNKWKSDRGSSTLRSGLDLPPLSLRSKWQSYPLGLGGTPTVHNRFHAAVVYIRPTWLLTNQLAN